MIPNVFISISGVPKSGKSHLALTCPPPIVVYSFDVRGVELLVDKPEFKDKAIDVRKFTPPIADTTLTVDKEAPKFWKAIKDDYKEAIEGGKFKTVVIDPATMVWEIIRHAWLAELQQLNESRRALMSRDYGEPNARMLWLLTNPLVVGMNVVSIQYLRERYVNDQATGEKELDGFKRTEGLADLVLMTEAVRRTATAEEKKALGKDKKNVVKTTIARCRFDRDLDMTELEDTDYSELMTLLGVE